MPTADPNIIRCPYCPPYPLPLIVEESWGSSWALSLPWLQVKQKEYEVLCVSQFTLYGRLQKTKPDFSKAMPPQQVRRSSTWGGGNAPAG
jgi:hypothetical protein